MPLPVAFTAIVGCGSLVTAMKSGWELSRMIKRMQDQHAADEAAAPLLQRLRQAHRQGVILGSEYDELYGKFLVARRDRDLAAMRTIRTRLRILFDEADTETKMSKEHRGINRGRERDRDRDSAAQKPWGQSSSRYPASEMSQQRISSSWNSRTLPTAADSPLLSSDEVEQPSRGESPKTRYYPVEPIAKLLPEIRRAASVSHSRGRSPIRSVKSRYRDRRDSRDEARLKERVYKREAEKEFGTDCESGGSYPSN